MKVFNILFLKRLLVWTFLFLLPSQLGTFFFMNFSYIHGVRVDYLAPAVYVTDLVFLLLCGFFWRHIKNHIHHHVKDYSILSALAILNISFSLYPLWAFYIVLKLTQTIFLYFIFSSLTLKSEDVLSAFSASAALQLVLTLMQFAQKSSLQGVFYYLGERYMTLSTPGIAKASFFGEQILRPYGTFSHPNSLAGYFLLIYGYALMHKTKSVLKPVTLALTAMLVLISFSKLAIFTFVFINIGYFIFFYSKKCTACTIARFSILLVVAGIFLQTHTDPLSFEKRLWLFKQGLSIIMNNPFFGTGFGHHLFVHAAFPDRYSYFFLQPVHNIFVLFAMQAGLVLTSAVGYTFVQHARKHSHTIRACGIPVLAVLLFTGSGDHYWLTLQQNMLLVGVVWGLVTGYSEVRS